MTEYAYGRVSTTDQNATLQRNSFASRGIQKENVYIDEGVSGKLAHRPELDKVLDRLKEGDMLTVWRLDRLGRSVGNLIHLVEMFKDRGIELVSIKEQIDTTTPTGKLMFYIFAAIAEFERDLIRERTLAGLAVAWASGKQKGRPRALTPEQEDLAYALIQNGQSIASIARTMNVGRSTIYRAIGKLMGG
jgi:DNA invertase Pin-like site-specific DNA recombinase